MIDLKIRISPEKWIRDSPKRIRTFVYMRNLYHETKQAFYLSLVFYVVSSIAFALHLSIGPVLVSVSLLVSLIWVVLVLREIILSPRIDNGERFLLLLFVIIFNILAGMIYFFMVRDRVIGKQTSTKNK